MEPNIKWCCESSLEEVGYGHGELQRPWPVKVVGNKWYNFNNDTGEIDDDDNASNYITEDTAIFDTKEEALKNYRECLKHSIEATLNEIEWCDKEGNAHLQWICELFKVYSISHRKTRNVQARITHV